MDTQDKKKSSKKYHSPKRMPSAPIKAPTSNIRGIGKKGVATGGLVPTMVAPTPGGKGNPGTAAQIGRGLSINKVWNSRKK